MRTETSPPALIREPILGDEVSVAGFRKVVDASQDEPRPIAKA